MDGDYPLQTKYWKTGREYLNAIQTVLGFSRKNESSHFLSRCQCSQKLMKTFETVSRISFNFVVKERLVKKQYLNKTIRNAEKNDKKIF